MAIRRVIRFNGIDIGQEFDPGDVRFIKPLTIGYGHIRNVQGADGMSADAYVGPNASSNRVFKITQIKPEDGSYDEDKFMFGFNSKEEAERAYLDNMPAKMFGGIEDWNNLPIIAKKKQRAKENTLGIIGRVLEQDDSGLPTIVEIEGPAEGISANNYNGKHREWHFSDLADGAKVTNDKYISKEIYPRVQYGHPFDDPEETGKEPAGEMLSLKVYPNTKRLKSQAKLFKNPNGIEVAQRFKLANEGKGEWPDYSIRARVECEDDQHMVGRCKPRVDGEVAPLLWDFLRPGERPGLAGSHGTRVVEAHCCSNCKQGKPCQKKRAVEEVKFDLVGFYISNFLKDTNKGGYAGGVETMSTNLSRRIGRSAGETAALANFHKAMAAEPDKDKREAMAKGFAHGHDHATHQEPDGDEPPDGDLQDMNDSGGETKEEGEDAEAEEKYAKEMGDMVGAMKEPEMPKKPGKKDDGKEDGEAEEAYQKAVEKYRTEKAIYDAKKAALEAAQVFHKVERIAVAKNKVKPNGTIQTRTRTSEPTHKAAEKKITKEEIAQTFGVPVAVLDYNLQKSAKEMAASTLDQDLRKLLNRAIESKQDFLGSPIWDTGKFPPQMVEASMKAAIALGTMDEAKGFMRSDLMRIPGEAKRATEKAEAEAKGELNNDDHKGRAMESYATVGESNEVWGTVAKLRDMVIANMKEMDPDGFKRYAKRKDNPLVKASEEAMFKRCVETYGGSAILAYNKKPRAAREDINSIGFSQMPNYPAVMTALMMVRQWRRSPVWDLVGNSPGVAMKLGQVIGGNGGPMGQFIEVYTENRSQRKAHDAAFIQSAGDPQREISVTHAPHQYFAYQETTRVRWDTELDYFLSIAPLMRDVPMRLLFNLMEELDYYTELRISTEILRANDEYKSTTLGPETTNILKTQCWNFVGGVNGVTAPDGTFVANGIGWVWLRRGLPAATTTPVYGPVVRPGVDPVLDRSTLTFPPKFPITINPINGIPQFRGMYDPGTQLGIAINASDQAPTFILLADIGVVVFLQNSGFDATHMPTITQYSRADNNQFFDFTPLPNETLQGTANRYVQMIAAMKAVLAKRQTDPNAKTFLLASDAISQAVVSFASHFQGLNQLAYAGISTTYEPEADYVVANLRRTRILSTTDPLFNNDERAVLGTENLQIYNELIPPVLGDLQNGGIVDQNGNLQYTSQVSRSVTRRALIATIPPRDPASDAPINFGSQGVFHVTTPSLGSVPI